MGIEGEGEVAFFSAKRWDRRNRADLIESATPCHDAVVGPYRDSNPLRLTILATMSDDYTTARISSRDKNGTDSIPIRIENRHISIAQLTYNTSNFDTKISTNGEKWKNCKNCGETEIQTRNLLLLWQIVNQLTCLTVCKHNPYWCGDVISFLSGLCDEVIPNIGWHTSFD